MDDQTPDPQPDAAQPAMMRKVDLVDRVVADTGLKKRDVKPAIESALAIIGAALSAGEPVNLQPLGKISVRQTKALDNGQVLTLRVRRSKQALAEPEN